MQNYGFTIIVNAIDDDTVESLAGKCPDSGVGTREGITYVDFDRDAESLGAAIDSALGDLQQIGVTAISVLAEMPHAVRS